jgi:hypothetical protein
VKAESAKSSASDQIHVLAAGGAVVVTGVGRVIGATGVVWTTRARWRVCSRVVNFVVVFVVVAVTASAVVPVRV